MYIHAAIAVIGSISVLLILELGEGVPISFMEHTLLVLVEKACVIVVIAYVISRLRYFTQILEGNFTIKNQIIMILVFGAISIFGTYSGIHIFDAIANIRDLAPMVAGLIGGPILGVGAGLIGGVYRYSLGGFTALPCSLATVLSGFLAGIIFLANKRRFVGVFWAVVFAVLMESLHMGINLLIAKPYSQALAVVSELSGPMIFANALGMLIFAFIISNQLRELETIKQRDLYFDELERKKHELQVANKIQRSFLPHNMPVIPGFDLDVFYSPAYEMGGDFYDIRPISDSAYGVAVADVSGESFPASLLMALSQTIIKNEAKRIGNPKDILKYLNHLIAVDVDENIHIHIVYGNLDYKNKTFKYVNAANNPPLLFQNKNQDVIDLEKGEKCLGRLESIELTDHILELEKGDILIFYTNGLIQALETGDNEGKQVLIELIQEGYKQSASDIISLVKSHIHSLEDNPDDLILLVLKVDK